MKSIGTSLKWATVLAIASATAVTVAARTTPDRSSCSSKTGNEYEQTLDAYFEHARGESPSAVVLRVYGGLSPEYELVLDPEVAKDSLFWYEPEKSIWGNAYDGLITRRRSHDEYVSRALKIPFARKQVKISEAQFLSLISRAADIDTTICERLPHKGSKGETYMIADAPLLEIITNGGRTRAKITDTSDFKEILSQNPALLAWATDVQKLFRASPH
jgi:hypothetical protein